MVLVSEALLGGRSDVGPKLTGVLRGLGLVCDDGWMACVVCACARVGVVRHRALFVEVVGLVVMVRRSIKPSRTWMIQSTTLGP